MAAMRPPKGKRVAILVGILGIATLIGGGILSWKSILQLKRDWELERKVNAKLDESWTFEYPPDCSLEDAIKTISSLSAIKFDFAEEAMQWVRKNEPKVNLPEMKNWPLKRILEATLENAGHGKFQYMIKKGGVTIWVRIQG
jgi:hypothetical protein